MIERLQNSKVQDILENTICLLQDSSFEELSVVDICKANHITKPTFYKYIGSKEIVLELYVDLLLQKQINEWQGTIEPFLPHLLSGLSIPIFTAQEMGPDLLSSYFRVRLKQQITEHECLDVLKKPLKFMLEKAQAEGIIRNQEKAEEIYRLILNLYQGIAIEWIIREGQFNIVDRFYESLKAVLNI